MPQALFRFYAELNDFLPRERRQVTFAHSLTGRASVKDVIESLGVPHTEVDLILVNGISVDFSTIVADGDQISVYPVFEALDIRPVVRLRPQPLREPAFVLDTHLGKLAAHLRLLGFDTLYTNDCADDALLRLSVDEKRILLTRDRGLLKRRELTHGYCVRAADPTEQIREVLEHFDLWGAARPFTRCLSCNGRLEAVPPEAVGDRVPPDVQAAQSEYMACPGCGRVFWRGSHYDHLRRFVEAVLSAGPAGR
jgi:uncharacterized protein with PIN domain